MAGWCSHVCLGKCEAPRNNNIKIQVVHHVYIYLIIMIISLRSHNWDLNQSPSCCEATVLNTAPLYPPIFFYLDELLIQLPRCCTPFIWPCVFLIETTDKRQEIFKQILQIQNAGVFYIISHFSCKLQRWTSSLHPQIEQFCKTTTTVATEITTSLMLLFIYFYRL